VNDIALYKGCSAERQECLSVSRDGRDMHLARNDHLFDPAAGKHGGDLDIHDLNLPASQAIHNRQVGEG
jgi:hypothetical protein